MVHNYIGGGGEHAGSWFTKTGQNSMGYCVIVGLGQVTESYLVKGQTKELSKRFTQTFEISKVVFMSGMLEQDFNQFAFFG